jgi:hypothetical protein
MPTFSVPIVSRELLPLWYDYNSNNRSAAAISANKDGSLGRTYPVDAKTAKEAAKKAEAQNPGCVAITNSIKKVG